MRAWRVARLVGRVGAVIDHADEALERWLSTVLDIDAVTFVAAHTDGSSTDGSSTSASSVEISLLAVSERRERRDTEVRDVRDDEGRVTARQRSLRYFDVDYRVAVTGDARAAHATLGRLLQALVDVDTIAEEHLPELLRDTNVPIEIGLLPTGVPDGGATGRSGVGLDLRMLLPVRPSADGDIAAPAVALHLDVSPPPDVAGAARSGADRDTARQLLGERSWTTVRRREEITRREITRQEITRRPDTAAAVDGDSPAVRS